MPEVQQRTAEQLFKILGELKGGAMKFGQALSVFEAALPEELAAPYRATLTQLQDSAPPMPTATVHQRAGPRARRRLARAVRRVRRRPGRRRLDRPGAPGPLGRRARGRGQGAVPRRRRGAAVATSRQLGRVARTVGRWFPGIDVKPLVAELQARVAEELDYAPGGRGAAAFADGVPRTTPTSSSPTSSRTREQVLVTEWLDGTARWPG